MQIPFYISPAYKFCSAATLSLIVRNRSLRFSRADTFNDAFELSPFLIPLDWQEIVKLSETNMSAAKQLADTAFQKVCSSLYITCFSKNYMNASSHLMWAHYASNHQGVCFCIDFSLLNQSELSKGYYPVEVQYSSSLLEERNKRSQTSPDLGLLIGATKSDVWSYEEEVRVVIETGTFDQTKFTIINDGKNISVVFNPKCITKVIFGLKSSPSDIQNIAESFCDVGHIPIFTRLDLDPLTLSVVEKDIGLREKIIASRDGKLGTDLAQASVAAK